MPKRVGKSLLSLRAASIILRMSEGRAQNFKSFNIVSRRTHNMDDGLYAHSYRLVDAIH